MPRGKRCELVNGYCGSSRRVWAVAFWGPLVVAALCVGRAPLFGSEQSRPPARARTVVGVFECVVGSRGGARVCALPHVGLRTCDPHAIDEECDLHILRYTWIQERPSLRSGGMITKDR